jgi:pteridine reductase
LGIPKKRAIQLKNKNNQTALITGAGKRIGKAIALALASGGTNVIVHYNKSEDAAREVVREIRSGGCEAWTVQADLTSVDQTETLIERARKKAGCVDVLINSAAVFPSDRIMDFTKEGLNASIQLNAFAPLQLARDFAKGCQDGVIINLLDSRMNDYDDEHMAYHLSKRMLYSVTRLLAIELAPAIRVCGVAPGLVLPPPGQDDSYLRKLIRTNPLERIGSLKDVTDAVRFLVEAEFVTGQVVFVDGGRNLRGAVYG